MGVIISGLLREPLSCLLPYTSLIICIYIYICNTIILVIFMWLIILVPYTSYFINKYKLSSVRAALVVYGRLP